jgi:hypothetical protein
MKTFRFVFEQRPDSPEDTEFNLEYNFPTYKDVNTQVNFGDDIAWTDVMDEFVSFLGSVYGYDIHEDVKYKDFDTKFSELLRSQHDD